ncbi:hypothetical protein Q8A67_000022 [Cirrhinus molitorella]|uniref:Uncharacterized protein n=1 Tax=Cirrhinus molitorella TaxID=172907 RepID=A0AA88QEH9_9TELE|nr:hypothetical protein Q8A67_000022 [Cirrhinus molitorella]
MIAITSIMPMTKEQVCRTKMTKDCLSVYTVSCQPTCEVNEITGPVAINETNDATVEEPYPGFEAQVQQILKDADAIQDETDLQKLRQILYHYKAMLLLLTALSLCLTRGLLQPEIVSPGPASEIVLREQPGLLITTHPENVHPPRPSRCLPGTLPTGRTTGQLGWRTMDTDCPGPRRGRHYPHAHTSRPKWAKPPH